MQMAQANSFSPISISAVKVLARLAAKNAVKEQLRGQGVRVTLTPPAEIAARANEYLSAHPELYQQALERAKRMRMYEKPKGKRKAITQAQPNSIWVGQLEFDLAELVRQIANQKGPTIGPFFLT
jgi:hypothetical protein